MTKNIPPTAVAEEFLEHAGEEQGHEGEGLLDMIKADLVAERKDDGQASKVQDSSKVQDRRC